MGHIITKWSRTPDTWSQEFQFFVNKTLIQFSSTGEYKRWEKGIEESVIIDSVNVIPVMTSDTSPSGIASASSSYNPNSYQAWKAFDGISSQNSGWFSINPSGEWLAYEFPVQKQIVGYSINARNYFQKEGEAPKSWTFEGWDGGKWVILDERMDEIEWSLGETRIFEFANHNSYSKYRINISSNNGGQFISICELEMFDGTITPAIPSSWQTVSTSLPTQQQFIDEGMDNEDLLALNRKITSFNQDMIEIGALGNGRKFSTTIDLNKYFDIKEIRKV